jgi:Flp pilus assembly pilin Flp
MGMTMPRLLRRLRTREDGQDLAEYGIALAIITATVGLIAAAVGADVATLWQNAQPAIATVVAAE